MENSNQTGKVVDFMDYLTRRAFKYGYVYKREGNFYVLVSGSMRHGQAH